MRATIASLLVACGLLQACSPQPGQSPADHSAAPVAPPARAKYGNNKVEIDGKKFDSKAEGARYVELKRLQEGGVISGLRTQEEFALPVNGVLVCKYLADFCYVDSDGNRVVEDVKGGPVTQVYALKKKLMKAIHGIEIKEVRRAKRKVK